jgi:hypothetical protein
MVPAEFSCGPGRLLAFEIRTGNLGARDYLEECTHKVRRKSLLLLLKVRHDVRGLAPEVHCFLSGQTVVSRDSRLVKHHIWRPSYLVIGLAPEEQDIYRGKLVHKPMTLKLLPHPCSDRRYGHGEVVHALDFGGLQTDSVPLEPVVHHFYRIGNSSDEWIGGS